MSRRNYEKPCPDCGAEGLERCKTKQGKETSKDHLARRVRNARIIYSPMPEWQKLIILGQKIKEAAQQAGR